MRVLLSLASVIVVVAGLKSAAELFIPIMLGFFLALLSLPILNWLDRRGFPRPLAVLTTVLVDLLILGFIVFLAFSVLGDFQKKTKGYAELLRDRAATFSVEMDRQIQRFGDFWDQTPDSEGGGGSESIADPEVKLEPAPALVPAPAPVKEGAALNPDGTAIVGADSNQTFDLGTLSFKDLVDDYFDTNRVVAFIAQFDVVSRFTTLATHSFFALIVMVFVLAESGSYAHKVHDVLNVRGPDLSRFQNTSRDIQKYLGIKTAVSFVTGLLATLVCVIFRIEFPLLWGLVAFLFNYVPAIGSIVAAIPPTLLALISHGFWWAAGVLALYLIINVSIGNFLEPMLLGDRFGISTVIVILSVLFWGYVWGPVGMLLAVPLTMMVKVMLDNSSDLRWISAFMGKGTGMPHTPGSGPESGEPDTTVEG